MTDEAATPAEVRFVPSRVEGLPDVREVAFFPDRLEINTAGDWVTLCWTDMARRPRPAWLWKRLHTLGVSPRWLPVGERDWFHDPPDRLFRFYTDPPLEVRMPADEPVEYKGSHFARIKEVLAAGGFDTWDLG